MIVRKRKVILMAIFFIITTYITSEEVLFRVTKDTPAWTGSFFRDDNIALIIKKDEFVTGISASQGICRILYKNQKYGIMSDMLIPATTDNLFDVSWVTGYIDESGPFWILSDYLNVLSLKDRDTFYKFEHKSIDYYNQDRKGQEKYWEEWYNIFKIEPNLRIDQAVIYVGGFYIKTFFIKNIKTINNGYRVKVVNYTFEDTDYNNADRRNIIAFPTDRPSFDLLLIQDSDYLDMYLDTTEKPIASFVRTSKIVLDQLDNLLKTNTCDLSNISWPRRSNGSMDYPPPLDMSNYSSTHRTLDNLRLRDSPDTTSKLVTTMQKGTEVQVIETGSSETIDGITAPWVKVISSTGYTGWCFGGYLKEIKKQGTLAPVSTGLSKAKEEAPIQTNAKSNTTPLWVWVSVISGTVIIVCGIVFIVKRRKNKWG